MSFMASKIIENQLFIQQFVQADNKRNSPKLQITGFLCAKPTGHQWILILKR